nr:unnamed protein product [Callosobruchus chinensis]
MCSACRWAGCTSPTITPTRRGSSRKSS